MSEKVYDGFYQVGVKVVAATRSTTVMTVG